MGNKLYSFKRSDEECQLLFLGREYRYQCRNLPILQNDLCSYRKRAIVYTNDDEKTVNAGEAIIAHINIPVGIKTDQGTIYTEIMIGENSMMNSAVKPGEVFGLKDLVPYQDGKIVNMDVAHNEKMKFVVMAFDAGTGLSEHAAPGEALVFALDGSATIIYEGVAHEIHAGEQFCFAKGGLHAVTATEKFKMALLLTL